MDYSNMSDDQLRSELEQFNVKVGPIVASTRDLYIKKLQRLKGSEPTSPSKPAYDEVDEDESSSEEEPVITKPVRPMTAKTRSPQQSAGDSDLRHRRAGGSPPMKKIDVKVHQEMEKGGNPIFSMLARLFGFLILFAIVYYMVNLYMPSKEPRKAVSGPDEV